MVVETAADGQACIEFLKKHGLGRMNFIVLDLIRPRAEAALGRAFHCPAKAQRLFDLVEPAEERLRYAFYFTLRNTLVTSDLDTAVGFAYEGNRPVHRVVTLKGDLIDTTGTLSGGGKTVRRGGMLFTGSAAAQAAKAANSSRSDDEITQAQVNALEKKAEACSEALAECRSISETLKQERKQVEESLKRLRKSLPKLEMAIAAAEKSLPDLQARAEVLRPRCEISAADAKRVKELEASVAKARKDSAGTKKTFDALQKEIDDLQGKILAAGGEPVKKLRAAVAKATAVADEADAAVQQANVDLKDCQKAAAKATKAKSKAESDLEALEAKNAKIMEEFDALAVKAAAVNEAYKAAQATASEMAKNVAATTKELDNMRKEIAKIAEVEVDIVNQAEEYVSALKDNEKKAAHWLGKIKELKEAHIADFQEWGPLSTAEDDADGAAVGAQATEEIEGGAEEKDVAVGDDVVMQPTEPEPLKEFTAEQLAQYDKEDLKYEIALLEEARDQLVSSVNMTAIAEYQTKQKEYLERFGELESSTEARDVARATYEDLRRQRLDEFMAGFAQITLKLKEMYQMITLGGDAELELVDSLDPFSEGIVFSVRPPKKSWKNIANLSGGEKTLSSLALVFALHHYKPTPLYVMDEIDAALDFKNVSIVANYIKERTKNAQVRTKIQPSACSPYRLRHQDLFFLRLQVISIIKRCHLNQIF